jgi:alpha/beta hydrolase fold
MYEDKKPQEVDQNRRHFFGTAAMVLGAMQLGAATVAESQPVKHFAPAKPGGHTSLGPIKQINAGVLNVGYAEAGPADGPAVILLHGWPYDIHSFVDVAPLLALQGYRVIVPYLRGYGSTRFLSSSTLRNGEQVAVALDVIALMDVLQIKRAIIGGFDWARARRPSLATYMLSERSYPRAYTTTIKCFSFRMALFST